MKVSFYLTPHWARCNREGKPYRRYASVDGDIANHAKIHDVDTEFGVNHVSQSLSDVVFGGHCWETIGARIGYLRIP